MKFNAVQNKNSDIFNGHFVSTHSVLKYRSLVELQMHPAWYSGPWFNIKMTSYQYRKSHCGDKTILRPSYLHNGISYTGKTTSLYWIGAQFVMNWDFSDPPICDTSYHYLVGLNMSPWSRWNAINYVPESRNFRRAPDNFYAMIYRL